MFCGLSCHSRKVSCAVSSFFYRCKRFWFTPVICKINSPNVLYFPWFFFVFFSLKSFNRPKWFQLMFYWLSCIASNRKICVFLKLCCKISKLYNWLAQIFFNTYCLWHFFWLNRRLTTCYRFTSRSIEIESFVNTGGCVFYCFFSETFSFSPTKFFDLFFFPFVSFKSSACVVSQMMRSSAPPLCLFCLVQRQKWLICFCKT